MIILFVIFSRAYLEDPTLYIQVVDDILSLIMVLIQGYPHFLRHRDAWIFIFLYLFSLVVQHQYLVLRLVLTKCHMGSRLRSIT